MSLSRLVCLFSVLAQLAGCASAEPPVTAPPSPSATTAPDPRSFTLEVVSGREQPATRTDHVAADQPVTLVIRGLGPARAKVIAPDGSRVATADAVESGNVVHRFRPSVAGRYRVVVAESEGTVLLLLDVVAPGTSSSALARPAPSPSNSTARDTGYWCGHDKETAQLPRCGCFGANPNPRLDLREPTALAATLEAMWLIDQMQLAV